MKSLWLLSAALLLAAPQMPMQAQTQAQTQHQNFRIDKVQRSQRTQLSDKKSFSLSYTPTPDPIPLNQHFRIRVQVQNAANKLLDGAVLTADATMPEHNHGMNVKPKVKALGKGVYEIQGFLFHMAGYWEIAINVQHGGKREKVIFGATVAMKPTEHHGNHH